MCLMNGKLLPNKKTCNKIYCAVYCIILYANTKYYIKANDGGNDDFFKSIKSIIFYRTILYTTATQHSL